VISIMSILLLVSCGLYCYSFGEEWYAQAISIFTALNTVCLIVTLLYVSTRNHFFPITLNRSPWWPWASCFSDVCSSPECCSQFALDEYSFTHYNHGFYAFPLMITLPLRIWGFPRCGKAFDPTTFDMLGLHISIFLEIVWEFGENTSYIINKFRNTSAPDYSGDSGMNIVGDVLCCAAGYVAIEAILNYSYSRYGWKVMLGTIGLHIIAIEGLFFIWVCDGLFIIWVNLSGLAVISLCGPNYYWLMLFLSLVAIFAGWALPLFLIRSMIPVVKRTSTLQLVPPQTLDL